MDTRVPRPDGHLPEVPPVPASEVSAEAPPEVIAEAQEVQLATTESREARNTRISTGVLVALMALLMGWLSLSTKGSARFALSDAFAKQKLPTISTPGLPIVVISTLALALAAVGFFIGRRSSVLRKSAGVIAALAVVIGFLTWAAAGRDLPFPVANQITGTIVFATPLVLGGLCGVMCERAGVVNVAIEGQMLTAAFAAAIVGSKTQSITWALVAAVIAGVLMAALLALFAINYLVDQVVLGVVINLFASGLTGFLFDQLVKPKAAELNDAPTMKKLRWEWLENATADNEVLGKVVSALSTLFSQTVLVYLALASVVLVWFILSRTKWGLRIRAVGEHPKAADTVGINVLAVRWSAVLAGGVFAGLGGAFFTIGSIGAFNKDITVGNGFIALAALIMGRWKPGLVALMALFFGFVQQMASQLQTINTPIKSQWLLILPYVATIIAVAGLVGRVRAPAADGVPYTKA